MFLDENEFPFLNDIKQNVSIISGEFFEALKKYEEVKYFYDSDNPTIYNHVLYWIKENKFHPDDIGYEVRDGIWASFPVYKSGFPVNWYDVKAYFPETLRMLKHVPGLNFASFMRLDPDAKTTPHKHLMKNNIFHLLLNDLDGSCEFQCDGAVKATAKTGDSLLFDYSKMHSSNNKSATTRIDFTIDFDPFLYQL
jgi:hypothetical protein